MGVPTSEVGHTSAMPTREDHEVRKGHVGHWIKKKSLGHCKLVLHEIDEVRPRTGHEGPGGSVVIAMLSSFNATPRPLYSWKRPGTHCTGGEVSTTTSLDRPTKSRPHRDSIPVPSSPYRVAIPTELSRPTLTPNTRPIYIVTVVEIKKIEVWLQTTSEVKQLCTHCSTHALISPW